MNFFSVKDSYSVSDSSLTKVNFLMATETQNYKTGRDIFVKIEKSLLQLQGNRSTQGRKGAGKPEICLFLRFFEYDT